MEAPATLVPMLVLPWCLGAALLSALGVRWRDDRLAFAGHAWIAGGLLLAIVLHAWLLLALPLERVALAAAVVALAAALALLGRAHRSGDPPRLARRPRRAGSWWVAAALVVVLAITLHRIVCAADLPVLFGDEAEIWARKAKA